MVRGFSAFGSLSGGLLVLAGLASVVVVLLPLASTASGLGWAYIASEGPLAHAGGPGGRGGVPPTVTDAAVGSVVLGSLLYYLTLGGGGSVRLLYAYTGRPPWVLAGLGVSWLLSSVGMSLPYMLLMLLRDLGLGDALALALGMAAEAAGVALILAVASGRFEGLWATVAGALLLLKLFCNPLAARYCAVASVSASVATALAGWGYWYIAASLAVHIVAPLAAAGRWGRP